MTREEAIHNISTATGEPEDIVERRANAVYEMHSLPIVNIHNFHVPIVRIGEQWVVLTAVNVSHCHHILISPLKQRKMENNQTPSECKHYQESRHCGFTSRKCSNPKHRDVFCGLSANQYCCPDYEPKEKKDNGNN